MENIKINSLKFQQNQLMSLNNSDVLPSVYQLVMSELSEIEILHLDSRMMYLASLLIEASAVLKHGLNILPPIPDIHVLSLLNFLFDSEQVHWV